MNKMGTTNKNKMIKRLGKALLVGILLSAYGCNNAESSKKLLEEARAYHQKGDNKAAVIQLKNTLQKNPDNGEARYLLGVVYNELGNGASAEKELRKALQLRVDKATVLPELGKSLFAQGEFQKILDEIQPGAEMTTGVAPLLSLQGHALLALGRKDEAKVKFEEALKKDANHAEAYLGMARWFLVNRNIEEALRQIDTALNKAPGNVDGLLLKGDLLRTQSKKDQAQATYQQALKAAPSNPTIRLRMASMLLADNNFDAARSEIAAVRKAEPKNLTALYMQALADFRQGKYAAARDTLQELLKLAPKHQPSVLLSGSVAFALGNYEQADKELGEFRKQNPGNIFAARMLAATQLKLNRATEALEMLRPFLAASTQDPGILTLAGEAHMQNREYAKATELLGKAAAIDPKSANIRTELGLSKLASGNAQGAMDELESASGLDASLSKADTILILAHISKQEFDKALQAVAVMQKKQPNNPLVFNLQGAAYLGKKDRVNARKSYEKALSIDSGYVAAAMNLAQMDLDDHNMPAARKRFEDLLAKDKNNQQAMVSLAVLSGGEGKESEYVAWLEKAAKTSASATKPRLMLARYYLDKGDKQRALMTARETQAAKPNDPDVLDVLGLAQLANGEKDNALATFSKLATIAPKVSLVHLRLATVQAMMQNPAAARVSLNKVLEIKPGDLDALSALVSLEITAGHFAEAQKAAQLAQKADPKSAVGWVLEGDILAAQKQYTQAVGFYDKAYALNKNGALVIKAHNALRRAGAAKEGETRMVQWLKERPDDFVVRNTLAESYMSEGRLQAAIEQYQYLNTKAPKSAAILNNLAWLYTQLKDPRAVGFAEQANKLLPGNPNIQDTLGWALTVQGKAAQGLEHLKLALTKVPDSPEVRYHLAVAYNQTGEMGRARGELERLLSTGVAFAQEREAKNLLEQLKKK